MEDSLFKMHYKIKLQLDAICQEAGDMNVEQFMQVYTSLKRERYEKAWSNHTIFDKLKKVNTKETDVAIGTDDFTFDMPKTNC